MRYGTRLECVTPKRREYRVLDAQRLMGERERKFAEMEAGLARRKAADAEECKRKASSDFISILEVVTLVIVAMIVAAVATL